MIKRVNVPTDEPACALRESVDVARAFGCGVMGDGRVYETPEGAEPCHDALRATGAVKPFWDRIATTEFPDEP